MNRYLLLALITLAGVCPAQFVVYDSFQAPPIIFPPGDYGRSVAGIGDVDGDGFDDYAFGTPTATLGQGRVLAYSGRTETQIWSVSGGSFSAAFGFDISGVGDLDGDGVPDVVVGDPLYNSPAGADAGRVVLLSGVDGDVIDQIDGIQAGAQLGYSVTGLKDHDLDGVADFAAGAPFYDSGGSTDNGRLRVYDGTSYSLLYSIAGLSTGDHFGFDVSGDCDFDGNGTDDVVVGAPDADENGSGTGEVFVYGIEYQQVGLPIIQLHVNVNGQDPGGRMGASVAGLGDINGDGLGDFIVGSPDEGNFFNPNAGHARVYAGPEGALLYNFPGATSDALGAAVANAGDVDGDGTNDFIVSLLEVSAAGTEEGEVRVYSGFDGQLIGSHDGDPTGGDYGTAVAGVGDLNGDGMAEIMVGDLPNQHIDVLTLDVSYAGSLEDLRLETGVGNEPLSLWPDRKAAAANSVVTMRLISPLGSYTNEIPAIIAQFFATPFPPLSPGGFPEIHVNPNAAFIVYDGASAPFFAPALLPAQGVSFSFQVPVGLGGNSLMLQGLALAPSNNQMNNLFTATNGQEIVF